MEVWLYWVQFAATVGVSAAYYRRVQRFFNVSMNTVARCIFAFFIATVASSIAMALYYLSFSNRQTTLELQCANSCDGARQANCERTPFGNGTFPASCGVDMLTEFRDQIDQYGTKRNVACIWMAWQLVPMHMLTSDMVALIKEGQIFAKAPTKEL
ncbi:hypothetical protein HK104_000590 [Borealophlyctis nickersoniae]|nr:hypothetical protein HK104_000590 [Borealophlyctis nickersoniae]